MFNFIKLEVDSKGQSIVEFMMFLPLIFVIFIMTIAISSSINGSINQQKATRSFFFFVTKSNPKYPNILELEEFSKRGLQTAGVHVIGWMDHANGEIPVATCYSLKTLITNEANDTCENTGGLSGGDAKSKFIRPYSMFGICSAYIYQFGIPGTYVDISSQAWSSGYCTRK